MRVTVYVNKYYDWKPVPNDVTVTEADVKSGRVRPAANGGYLMRVTLPKDTHTDCCIGEHTIVALMIHEMMPQQGNQLISRKEAVGLLLARNLMPHCAHRSFMRGFDVHDDPRTSADEEAFRAQIAPYVEAKHNLSGEPLIDPSEVEAMVAKYLEPATVQDHIDHLHQRFNVKKAPPGAPAPAGKAVTP